MDTARIAIIGGGPGGLLTAHQLQKRASTPFQVTIFESSNRLGGKICTAKFESAPIQYEAGAAELYDYSAVGPDPLAELIEGFGLRRRPLRGRSVFVGDQLIQSDQDIRTKLGEKTYSAIRQFTQRAKALISPAEYYESDWQADNADPLAKQTFAAYLQLVTDEPAREYIALSIHSDLATEPHQTNAVYGLQNYLMNEPSYMSLYTIEGGIERLIHELARRDQSQVKLGHRITGVKKLPNEKYRLTMTSDHSEISAPEFEDFDYVVVALPNNWIPAIKWQGDKLRSAMHRHHEHYDHPAHYLRVSVLFQKPFWREQINDSFFISDAFGGCCVYDESSRLDDCRHGVLGWLLAGEAAMTLSNCDDASLINRVVASLPACLAHGREMIIEGQVHRWIGSVNGLPGGYPMREPDSRHVPEPEDHGDLFVVGDYLFDSTLNGVMDSADTVAEWLAEEMQE